MSRASNIVSIFDNPEALRQQTAEARARKGWEPLERSHRAADPAKPNPVSVNRRQFRRFDEMWAEKLLAAGPSVRPETWRLMTVLLAEADFKRRCPISAAISTAASLTRKQKRLALEQLEQLGLIAVEWRGRGRVPIAAPLHLASRPGRR
jgi:hypothetical protein